MYKKYCGIYCIENIITNQKYIGQSVDINSRWYKHRYALNKNEHFNNLLQESWNKYGERNFKMTIIELCDKNRLDEKEIYYIEKYDSINNGFNIDSGGQIIKGKTTYEHIKRQSKSLKDCYNNRPELKQLRKNNALKQWSNPIIKEKITGENNGMYGRNHSDQTKEKIRQKALGRKSARRNNEPVLCVELNKKFKDAHTASKYFNIQSGCILAVCRGKRKTSGGYHWKFDMENNIS